MASAARRHSARAGALQHVAAYAVVGADAAHLGHRLAARGHGPVAAVGKRAPGRRIDGDRSPARAALVLFPGRTEGTMRPGKRLEEELGVGMRGAVEHGADTRRPVKHDR